MPDKFLKGALVSFMPTFVGALPNVIVFQYNPETMTHAWTPAAAPPPAPKAAADPMAVSGLPGESFSFKLSLSARDMIADGDANPVAAALATAAGVSTRLAALEMLLFPSGSFGGGLLGTVSASVSAGGLSLSAGGSAGATTTVPRSEVPTVLFVWGPQRIVPVRVTALSVTETLYDGLLNPIQADASLTLRVLTPDELASVKGELKQVSLIAYNYSQGLRQAKAVANLGDAAAAVIGMLPSPF